MGCFIPNNSVILVFIVVIPPLSLSVGFLTKLAKVFHITLETGNPAHS